MAVGVGNQQFGSRIRIHAQSRDLNIGYAGIFCRADCSLVDIDIAFLAANLAGLFNFQSRQSPFAFANFGKGDFPTLPSEEIQIANSHRFFFRTVDKHSIQLVAAQIAIHFQHQHVVVCESSCRSCREFICGNAVLRVGKRIRKFIRRSAFQLRCRIARGRQRCASRRS